MSKLFVDEMRGNTSTTISIPSGQTLNVAGNLSSTAGTISGGPTISGTPSFPDGAKVNTIKHTGGTTAMTIDSSGRILKPAIPRFSARMGGSGMSSNSESWTTMVFDNTLVNNGSCYNTSNGQFTAPVAGDYWFSTHVLQGSSSPAYGVLKWLKNGSTSYTGNTCYASTYDSWMSLSVILTLAANDTLVVQSYNRFSKADYGSFQGYLLG